MAGLRGGEAAGSWEGTGDGNGPKPEGLGGEERIPIWVPGSREPEAGRKGCVGFFKAVSGFFTILADWNENIIQTIWLKR